MEYLDRKLMAYAQSDVYPFHMPGHKRNFSAAWDPYRIDITEIDGFDNLHDASGVLREAQERAAVLYGAREAFYLVNGSTCGLLAAICAAVKKRDKVLLTRGCHKAVYHALFLNELHAEYLYPAITDDGLMGQITPEQVQKACRQNPDIAAVIVTSPTYEGIVSDIAGIAEAAHAAGIPLIVDEAHGAHFGLGGEFPENAIRLGADAVIMSLHKTLPSFTQTALLLLGSDRISEEQVKRYLGIFETSSPSYVLMAGMDACIRMLSEQGKELFSDYRRRLFAFYRSVSDLKYLEVLTRERLRPEDAFDWDDSKIIIFSNVITGPELHRRLLEEHRLQMEMVSAGYVLGMTSIMDSEEGLERLSVALHAIDAELARTDSISACNVQGRCSAQQEVCKDTAQKLARLYEENPCEMQIYQAASLPYREVPFEEAVGRMSADYIYLYPPGIPLIVPGEVLTEHLLEKVRACVQTGLNVQGLAGEAGERIKIVYF